MTEPWEELKEFDPVEFGEDETSFSEKHANFLVEKFSDQVEVEYPTAKTGDKWVLKNKGYTGSIPLPDGKSISLTPKVEISNVLHMMEYAYELGYFDLEGVTTANTVEGFYDRVAKILAQNIIDRRKRGLFRSYVEREEESQTIRGRINFSKTARRPWDPKAHIEYSEMTADNEDNQILLYTLSRISSSTNLCSEETLQKAREGIRSLREEIAFREFRGSDCKGRRYNRLNKDYERLHALCRLILENIGPSYESGDSTTIPFQVYMEDLYEKFVIAWLQDQVPHEYKVGKHTGTLTKFAGDDLKYQTDILITERETDDRVCVLDMKYKKKDTPEQRDIYQMIAYAKALEMKETFLVYPVELSDSLDVEYDDVRVRDLQFSMDGDLEANGEEFLKKLSEAIGVPEVGA